MIRILEIRPQDHNGKALKAFVDVEVDGVIMRDFRIVKENGKKLWVASPQISWRDKDGFIKYKTIITLPIELKGEVDFTILSNYRRELEKKNGTQ